MDAPDDDDDKDTNKANSMPAQVEQLLRSAGLFIDELSHLRVIDPGVAEHSVQLKELASNYISELKKHESQTLVMLANLNALSEAVDREKMRAMSKRGVLKSIELSREDTYQRLRAIVRERTLELQRIKSENEALEREMENQQEQLETIMIRDDV